MDEVPKYDVAFSFCAEDELLAQELNDLIEDRYATFLYSKRQEVLAGTDGEQSFSRVFGTESRLVVVFYRSKWGSTPFTRIEETAIRNRAFQKGYDFTLFIPCEKVRLPDWMPKTRLWYGWDRYGVKGAASVIEARIGELGGTPHEEEVLDQAARMNREADFQRRRKQFLESTEAVRQSDESFNKIASELERLRDELARMGGSASIVVRRRGLEIVVAGFNHGLSLYWQRYINSVRDCLLRVMLWNGHPPFPGILTMDEPKRLALRNFSFELSRSEHGVWLEQNEEREYSGETLANVLLKWLMDQGARRQRT